MSGPNKRTHERKIRAPKIKKKIDQFTNLREVPIIRCQKRWPHLPVLRHFFFENVERPKGNGQREKGTRLSPILANAVSRRLACDNCRGRESGIGTGKIGHNFRLDACVAQLRVKYNLSLMIKFTIFTFIVV